MIRLLISALFAVVFAQSDPKCQRDPIPILKDNVLLPFTAHVASAANTYSRGHFIISPPTMWLSLASVAESADFKAGTNELWEKNLHLPSRKCTRDQIYKVALGLETPGKGFLRNRALAIDDTVRINEDWRAFTHSTKMLDHLPVNYDNEPFGRVQDYMGIHPKVPLSGHSVFLDRLDWGGLWTKAFIDNKPTQGPFYNEVGKEIAKVDYYRMKSKVRVADIYNIRVVELPVGSDNRYAMVFAVGAAPNSLIDAVFSRDILSELKMSEKPVDVIIPGLSMSSGMDLRPVLSKMGLGSVFTDENVTSHISDPAALPMGYFQRVDINISRSLGKEKEPGKGLLSGFLEDVGESIVDIFKFSSNSQKGHYHFIANRPFLFALYERNVGVPVFAGVNSHPGQRGQPDFTDIGVLEKVTEGAVHHHH